MKEGEEEEGIKERGEVKRMKCTCEEETWVARASFFFSCYYSTFPFSSVSFSVLPYLLHPFPPLSTCPLRLPSFLLRILPPS